MAEIDKAQLKKAFQSFAWKRSETLCMLFAINKTHLNHK